jgi:hypothetical protein
MTTCSACRHWSQTGAGNAQKVGECRRSAPSPSTTGGPDHQAAWPKTLELDSCGEFTARKVEAIEKRAEELRTPRQVTKGGTGRRKR